MNYSLPRLGASAVVCLGIGCSMLWGGRLAEGQVVPDNPLRQAAVKRAEPVAAEATKANDIAPVRTAVLAESDEGEASAVVPASAVERPAPRHPKVHQPGGYSQRGRVTREELRGFVPRHQRVARTQAVEEVLGEPTPADSTGEIQIGPTDLDLHGETVIEEPFVGGMSIDGDPLAGDCCGTATASCGDCGGCGNCTACLLPCSLFALDNVELFAGAQGFTGPLNRGETGSFGFHYGVNWGVPMPCMRTQPFGLQLGYRGVSSNLSGASFSEDTRHQNFITAGLFRRVDWGLQGGAVIDVLSDKWYYDDLSLTQVRGELSWVLPEWHELGVTFTAGTKTNKLASATLVNGFSVVAIEEYEATDMMAFFYRARFAEIGNGYGRVFAGVTGNSGGLVGADFNLPLTENWALKTGFTYLIPQDGNNRVAYANEAWNVGATLVWYPGRRKAVGNDYFRPLFDVADNGTFIPRPSTN